MSVEVKRPKKIDFGQQFKCGEFSSLETNTVSKNMEKTSAASRGRGRAGDRLQRRANTISVTGLRGEGSRLQQYKKRRFTQAAKQNDSENFGFKRRRLGSLDMRGKRGVEKIVLPTKFLLGGNINDPLNLNSLNDEEVNRILNQKTPESSPLPVPSRRMNVEVKIPVNIYDPLNLNGGEDSDDPIVKSLRKRKRHRPKKKDNKDASTNSTGVSESNLNTSKPPEKPPNAREALMEALKIEIDPTEDNEALTSSEQQTTQQDKSQSHNVFSSSSKLTKIVSPVICQGTKRVRRRTISECGASSRVDVPRSLFRRSSSPDAAKLKNISVRKFRRQTSGSSLNKSKSTLEKPVPTPPKTFTKKPQFVHGNYNRYYGYRNPNMEVDDRLRKFRPEWFEGKDVLDIGCNVGHVTLAIARDFQPRRIVGMDIDHYLIRSARHNIRNFLSSMHDVGRYPASSAISYGPIEAPPVADSSTRFPRNVMFMQGNYVLERDEQLDMVKEEYDTILALSLTKWLHLNNGDAGLKRAFLRMFRQLRPGGRLILEPQPWASYRKRKKLTETIYKNYHSIELRPEMFRQYLLSEIGFAKCEPIDVPFNKSKGFRRPLLLFTKFDTQYNSPAAGLFATPVGTPRFGRLATAAFTSGMASDRQYDSYTPSMCSTCISCSSSCSSSPCSSCTSLQTQEQETSAQDEGSCSSYVDSSRSQMDFGEASVSSYGEVSQSQSDLFGQEPVTSTFDDASCSNFGDISRSQSDLNVQEAKKPGSAGEKASISSYGDVSQSQNWCGKVGRTQGTTEEASFSAYGDVSQSQTNTFGKERQMRKGDEDMRMSGFENAGESQPDWFEKTGDLPDSAGDQFVASHGDAGTDVSQQNVDDYVTSVNDAGDFSAPLMRDSAAGDLISRDPDYVLIPTSEDGDVVSTGFVESDFLEGDYSGVVTDTVRGSELTEQLEEQLNTPMANTEDAELISADFLLEDEFTEEAEGRVDGNNPTEQLDEQLNTPKGSLEEDKELVSSEFVGSEYPEGDVYSKEAEGTVDTNEQLDTSLLPLPESTDDASEKVDEQLDTPLLPESADDSEQPEQLDTSFLPESVDANPEQLDEQLDAQFIPDSTDKDFQTADVESIQGEILFNTDDFLATNDDGVECTLDNADEAVSSTDDFLDAVEDAAEVESAQF